LTEYLGSKSVTADGNEPGAERGDSFVHDRDFQWLTEADGTFELYFQQESRSFSKHFKQCNKYIINCIR